MSGYINSFNSPLFEPLTLSPFVSSIEMRPQLLSEER